MLGAVSSLDLRTFIQPLMDARKPYAVSQTVESVGDTEVRQRKTVLGLYGDSQGITWLEALTKAEKELEKERSRGMSLKGYYGDLPWWDKKMRYALAPTRFMYAIYVCWNVVFVLILQPYVAYMICQRILFTVGVFLIGCNITSKQFTAGDSFKRDDCVVFQMLRMVSNDRKALALARSSRLMGFTYSYSRVLIFPVFVLILASLWGVYVYRFQKMSLLQHTLFFLYNSFSGLCHADWFPFGLGIMSNYFVSMARLLSEMINTFKLIELKPNNVENGECDEKNIFSNAYKNYHIMVDVIKKFSEIFAAYFFYSEFTLLVGTVGMGVGCVDLVTSSIGGEAVTLELIAVWTYAISFFFVFVIAIKCIFSSAAQITESVKRVQHRVHRMEATLNLTYPSMQDDYARFYQHSERGLHLTGFRSMGIIISSNLGAKFTYGVFTVISSLLFYSIRYLDIAS